jgi:hypothetical protein
MGIIKRFVGSGERKDRVGNDLARRADPDS